MKLKLVILVSGCMRRECTRLPLSFPWSRRAGRGFGLCHRLRMRRRIWNLRLIYARRWEENFGFWVNILDIRYPDIDMRAFIDFDGVLFDIARHKREYFRLFEKHGISSREAK